jgi:hypothetical protein
MPRCNLCNDFQRSPRQFRLAFDFKYAEIVRSAQRGCLVCSLLLEGMRCFEPSLGDFGDHHRIYVWGGNVDGDGSVEMEIFGDGALKLRLEFFVAQGKTSILEGARMLPTIPGDTRAPTSMDWAKLRLQECADLHASCGQRSLPRLPTRVLEIEPDRTDRVKVRLLQTHGEEARYACLSHRWSSPAALVTSRANLASHVTGINWDALPRTFKEAILVTQSLELRYIWIDSLCIIQDDFYDREREVANMSSIYTNSYITIAATQSYGGEHGCFSEGGPRHRDHQISLERSDSSMTQTDLHVREKITHIGDMGAATPLLKRGWVCQERLLSPRLLHFCEKELVWECQESSSCQCSCFNPPIRFKERYSEIFHHSEIIEDHATVNTIDGECMVNAAHTNPEQDADEDQYSEDIRMGTTRVNTDTTDARSFWYEKRIDPLPGALHISYLDSLEETLRARQRRSRLNRPLANRRQAVYRVLRQAGRLPRDFKREHIPSSDLHDNVILRWRHIIDDYSGMNLIKQSDRLPAIAGVASQIGDTLNSKYLAGLWDSALPGDLLWRTDHTIESGQHRTQYRAPTWSWASVDGKIKHYRMTSYHRDFSIVHSHCNPISDINPFGEVTSGWLDVNAKVAHLEFTLNFCDDMAQSRRHLKVEFLGDTATFIPDYDISVETTAMHTRTHGPQYSFLCLGDFNIERTDASVSELRGGEPLAVSLVVKYVHGDTYERVGILERTPRVYPRPMQISHPGQPTPSDTEQYSRYLDLFAAGLGLGSAPNKLGRIREPVPNPWVLRRGLKLI